MTFLKLFKSYRTLEHLTFHDDLTQLKNRRYLYNCVDLKKFKYLYFIDLNDLHKINNEHGHSVGDKFIITTINNISQFIDDNDLFIRYAGDEFIVLSNNSNLLKPNKNYSFGYCKLNTTIDLHTAIEIADKQMLKCKSNI